jgi:hypothetical protein
MLSGIFLTWGGALGLGIAPPGNLNFPGAGKI